MDGQKTYKAFTLIEMLIVMGILIILMVVGVAAGRFAINRANEIANRNGATQLYQAMQAHYTDYGKYPEMGGASSNPTKFSEVINGTSGKNTIGQYLDMGSFGGKEATYSYFPNTDYQALLVCVTLGGKDDEGSKGVVCAGNGFGDDKIVFAGEVNAGNFMKDKIDFPKSGGPAESSGSTYYDAIVKNSPDTNRSVYTKEDGFN